MDDGTCLFFSSPTETDSCGRHLRRSPRPYRHTSLWPEKSPNDLDPEWLPEPKLLTAWAPAWSWWEILEISWDTVQGFRSLRVGLERDCGSCLALALFCILAMSWNIFPCACSPRWWTASALWALRDSICLLHFTGFSGYQVAAWNTALIAMACLELLQDPWSHPSQGGNICFRKVLCIFRNWTVNLLANVQSYGNANTILTILIDVIWTTHRCLAS